MRRGQAAMEYLMTYGWALLVIVIVIAVLILINPFGAAPQCIFTEPGFFCDQPAIPVIGANGELEGAVTNKMEKSITVYAVRCVSTSASQSITGSPAGTSVGANEAFNISATSPAVTCEQTTATSGTGSTTATGTFSKGAQFRGKLWLFYRYQGDVISGTMYRSASANIIADVV